MLVVDCVRGKYAINLLGSIADIYAKRVHLLIYHHVLLELLLHIGSGLGLLPLVVQLLLAVVHQVLLDPLYLSQTALSRSHLQQQPLGISYLLRNIPHLQDLSDLRQYLCHFLGLKGHLHFAGPDLDEAFEALFVFVALGAVVQMDGKALDDGDAWGAVEEGVETF